MRILLIVVAVICSAIAVAKGSHAVRAHVTKKGTYVQAHRATNPDKTQRNNWSSKPNVNPITGKPGTKIPKK